jgi:hypothetical protein
MPMPITKQSYQDLKEYWDFQRKIEFNKEKIKAFAGAFEDRVYNEFGAVHLNELEEVLWMRCKESDYDDPHPSWIPQNENYRFWWEGEPKPHHIAIEPPMKKGRPVVLRAKSAKDLDERIKHIFSSDIDKDEK